MLYYQSVHNNLKTRRERKHISNLIQFFNFQGKLLFSFSTWYFFISSFLLLTCQFFFFQSPKNIFFRRKRIQHSFFQFFIFLFKIKYHPISIKKQNEKPFFCIFFRNSKHIFLFRQVRVKNFYILMTS